jgi:CheY-like chemotaxis protein
MGIKIGGTELTFEEVSLKQRIAFEDLQSQIISMTEFLKHKGYYYKQQADPETYSILWVDDNPKNNLFIIDQLKRKNWTIDISATTSDGQEKFSKYKYDVIITDLSRKEDSGHNNHAGLDLLRIIRDRDKQIPFIIFCGPRNASRSRNDAMALGATGITSSTTELLTLLDYSIKMTQNKTI